jgi:hypothetical protein
MQGTAAEQLTLRRTRLPEDAAGATGATGHAISA